MRPLERGAGSKPFLQRLLRGRCLFVSYQEGNPQLDEVENAEGEAITR